MLYLGPQCSEDRNASAACIISHLLININVMKKISALIFIIFLFSGPVLADYTSAYNDYTFNYNKYRESYNAYQVAKSTYTTYRTLAAQSEAISQFRAVLQARDNVMSSYYDLLQEKLLASSGIPDESKTTFFKMKESEKLWIADHQKKVDAASSLEDLNAASLTFTSHYPQMDSETKQAIGMVLLAKESALTNRWDTLADNISLKLKEISLSGEDTSTWERAVISARNKKELAVTKISLASGILTTPNYQPIDLFSAQQRLAEANQYLREGINYLFEIINGITG